MKMKEVQEKSSDELPGLEEKLRKELADLRLKHRMGQLSQTTKMGSLRRDIARVLTVRKQRETKSL